MNLSTNTELSKKVEEALGIIRPFLEADGGDIALVEITGDLVVRLEYLGACKTCSMRESTFKAGIEESIKRIDPQIKSVEVINI